VNWLSSSLSNLWVQAHFLGLLGSSKSEIFQGFAPKLSSTLTFLNLEVNLAWLDFGFKLNPLPSNFGA